MTTTTTLSAMRHLLQDGSRFDRLPRNGGDSAFSALVPQGAAEKEQCAPTPVPTDLRNPFWSEAPTPVPTNPDDDELHSFAPTPVPTVAPEDAAALTHRLAYSLLTGTEFQLGAAPRAAADGEG